MTAVTYDVIIGTTFKAAGMPEQAPACLPDTLAEERLIGRIGNQERSIMLDRSNAVHYGARHYPHVDVGTHRNASEDSKLHM